MDAFFGQGQQLLAPVSLIRRLVDIALIDELAENPGKALFCDLQDLQQVGNGDSGVTSDEVDDPVMGPSEIDLRKNGVRLTREVPIGKEQHFDALPEFLLPQEKRIGHAFYVNHVDLIPFEC